MAHREDYLYQHLSLVLLFLILLLVIGTVGYTYLEGWSWFDALYMTFISFSTVGFQEVGPLHISSRLFTMFLIFMGMVVIAMLSASVTTWFVSNEILIKRKRLKMKQRISNLKGHIIICGAGDTGMTIIQEFQKAKKEFVVIEENVDVVAELIEKDTSLNIIEGNATKDDVLEEANIKNAAGLITALSLDAANLFVVVSARVLNPQINIISRSVDIHTESKLYNAGANYVISPNMVEGMRMASVILRPTVINFLEVMTRGEGLMVQMEEIVIPKGSSFHDKKLADIRIPSRTGLIVLAVKHSKGLKWEFNPGPDFILKDRDEVIVLGEPEKIDKLRLILRKDGSTNN